MLDYYIIEFVGWSSLPVLGLIFNKIINGGRNVNTNSISELKESQKRS